MFAPTPKPTPAPTAAPSQSPTTAAPTVTPAPSGPPSAAPSSRPTSAPTEAPKLTALPQTHAAVVTQPTVRRPRENQIYPSGRPNRFHAQVDEAFRLFVINLSRKELGQQCVVAAAAPTFRGGSNATVVFPNASWSAASVDLGTAVEDLSAELTFRFASAGATPGVYTYVYGFSECGSPLNDASPTVELAYEVAAATSREAATLRLDGAAPVLGHVWTGASIETAVDAAEFEVALSVLGKDGGYAGYATCDVEAGAPGIVDARCDVPAVDAAGAWNVTAALDGALVDAGRQFVGVACPTGRYEARGVCRDCPGGATCVADGLELASLPLAPGRWRSGPSSTRLRRCPLADACAGGNGTGDAICAEGYAQPSGN